MKIFFIFCFFFNLKGTALLNSKSLNRNVNENQKVVFSDIKNSGKAVPTNVEKTTVKTPIKEYECSPNEEMFGKPVDITDAWSQKMVFSDDDINMWIKNSLTAMMNPHIDDNEPKRNAESDLEYMEDELFAVSPEMIPPEITDDEGFDEEAELNYMTGINNSLESYSDAHQSHSEPLNRSIFDLSALDDYD